MIQCRLWGEGVNSTSHRFYYYHFDDVYDIESYLMNMLHLFKSNFKEIDATDS